MIIGGNGEQPLNHYANPKPVCVERSRDTFLDFARDKRTWRNQMIGTIIRAGLAILVIIIAFKLLKGILGLVVGIAIAAVIFIGAKNLLSGGGTKRIK